MTHAESQELLLDLAFGELDEARAAQVESHLAVCEECRTQKQALEEARRMAAPLREPEEPSAGFDERILEAARTQAQLDHDGNVGQVIEVSGNVRPLGVEPARIDAHGPVNVRPVERRRPRWMLRAALGGSIAVAAALALAVSTTLETRRSEERASRAQGDEYSIRVKPAAPQAVDSALRGAAANRELAKEAPTEQPAAVAEEKGTSQVPPAAFAKEGKLPAQAPPPERRPAGQQQVARGVAGGTIAAGEVSRQKQDAAPAAAQKRAVAPGAAQASAREEIASAPPGEMQAPPPAVADSRMRDEAGGKSKKRADSSAPLLDADAKKAVAPALPAERVPAAAAGKVKSEPMKNGSGGSAEEAGALETGAQQARHAGDYVKAAALYRSAADLRGKANDPGAAAWDLAHAIECLAAVGRFDEGRQVREELERLYPAETPAISAAHRALREFDVPSTQPPPKR